MLRDWLAQRPGDPVRIMDDEFDLSFEDACLNGRATDWGYWIRKMPQLDANEAARLVNGLDPWVWGELSTGPDCLTVAAEQVIACDNARKMLGLAEREGMGQATPRNWLKWAEEKGLPIHVLFSSEVNGLTDDAQPATHAPIGAECAIGEEPNAQPTHDSTPGAAPVPMTAESASVMTARRRTWRDVVGPYIVGIIQAGQYATAKELYRALEAKAGQDSPFEKGTGSNMYSLFIRETATPLTLKTLQNNWQELRTAATKK